MFEELLPFFSTSFSEGAYVVVGLLNLLLPTNPAPKDRPELQPQEFIPTFFHLWSLVNRSRLFDVHFIDIFSRLARDYLPAGHVGFSQHGIFTSEQSSLIFTAILRLLEIPVGQATSPYSDTVDLGAGLAIMLDRDQRKHPVPHHIARWIVMSLSPACLDDPNSILNKLEGLIQAVETFFHPSNSGSWTKTLSQLVFYLADFFVMRWNRERSGEMEVPEERKLNDPLKRRFVLCLREVIFMGIFAKSGTAINFSLSTLQSLAYLEPTLILPGALQRIYPAMQGLVEVHRTISSIRSLHMLSKIMARTKGYRCHVTTVLGLALPGIDANDLEKTLHTLSYIQGVCYTVPFHDLTKEKKGAIARSSGGGTETPTEGVDTDTGLAMRWITEQVDRLENAGSSVEIDYNQELSDEEEAMILRSSTTGLSEFLLTFLGRVFTLLENLPDASRVRSGSPEENVVNTLPAAFTPLLSALSPELFDVALDKIANFITNHVIHQARDAVAFICNALVKINPEKSLKRILPHLLAGIRTEIGDNGAGSTRTTGSEVLPRDRALVWNISLLSMCVVHVGDAVLEWKDELFEIAEYMQQKCRGIPTVHVSNFIHHLLLNLTVTYTIDYSIYEPEEVEAGLTTESWGRLVDPHKLKIRWHTPSREEIDFAIKLFENQASTALRQLAALTGPDPPINRDGTGKDWSDEVSRNLVLLRLIVSGISVLFDPRHGQADDSPGSDNGSDPDAMDTEGTDDDAGLGEAEDEEVKPTFQYEAGYPLTRGEKNYQLIHDLRNQVGETLHMVHKFLIDKQEDDVPCFNALYNAYKCWFIDVGLERSAHVLDRVTRLLRADVHPFKFSGLRKEYPRPLLVRRANVYHLQRLRHNANPRPKTELDKQLLLDLAESSISLYTEIRRTSQSANESAVKCVLGARPLVIPPLLEALTKAIAENDYPRIKGAMFSLLFGSLAKTISRDWRFTPTLIKAFIEVTGADKPSVQKLATNATFQVMDMGKALERMVILDKDVIESLSFAIDPSEEETVQHKVAKRRDYIKKKRARIEGKKASLSKELVDISQTAHWKKVSRTVAIIVNLGMRYDTIASDELVTLVTKGAIDPHPHLRTLFAGALVGLFSIVQTRAVTGHSYEKFLLGKEELPEKITVPTKTDDPNWTDEYLASFAKPEAKYYVDFDYPGWLVWNKTMPAYLPIAPGLAYDETEINVRKKIGEFLDRHWFSTFFAYLKQEPRDAGSDRFRMSNAVMLSHAFELVFGGLTKATFEDLKDLTQSVYGDGSDKHQHRATAEIMAALLSAELNPDQRQEVWGYCFPIVRGIFQDGLTPENSSYWTSFLHLTLQGKDPRRGWPLVDWLASFRLDMQSSAAFKESSKIHLLQQCICDAGWHFRLEKPILEDFLKHIDHPYKSVREAMGQTMASIYRTRYHESYKDVTTLIKAQKEASSLGIRPYQPTDEYSATITDVFDRLEVWRKERPAGQQTPSSYTSGGKTVLLWLNSTLSSYECTQLVKFFPNVFMEQLLHFMDIKEDPELQSLAYHVFRHLPNIPHRQGEDAEFIAALIRIGRTATSWHQRLRILINIQVVYFRRLFLMSEEQQQQLFDCVSAMLGDVQLEVRMGAATTLSGMIRCSPVALRERTVSTLKSKFEDMLVRNPLPKRRIPGTPTPEHNKLILTRHAAVLGLGALVQAFPYTSPPPLWLPEILATLARKAAADPGMVGKSVKSVLADFKKTRQDTWHVDVKVRYILQYLD
jgi:proteasome activator subunit 4